MAQQAGNHGLAARSAMNAADLSIETGQLQEAIQYLDVAADEAPGSLLIRTTRPIC